MIKININHNKDWIKDIEITIYFNVLNFKTRLFENICKNAPNNWGKEFKILIWKAEYPRKTAMAER